MNDVSITNHAYKRARKRFRWSSEAIEKMSRRAFEEGIKHEQTSGRLHRYLYKIRKQHGPVNNVRIYGQNAYLFCGKTLITLYRIPNNLINHLK